MNQAYIVLDLVSRAPQVSLGTANTCGHFLREIDPSRSIGGGIRVLDTQSRVICATDEALLGSEGQLPLNPDRVRDRAFLSCQRLHDRG